MVKHDDRAMTWYDNGDSYSPRDDRGMVIKDFSMIIA